MAPSKPPRKMSPDEVEEIARRVVVEDREASGPKDLAALFAAAQVTSPTKSMSERSVTVGEKTRFSWQAMVAFVLVALAAGAAGVRAQDAGNKVEKHEDRIQAIEKAQVRVETKLDAVIDALKEQSSTLRKLANSKDEKGKQQP